MKELVIVTNNRHKYAEIRAVLPAGYKLLRLEDIGFTEEIEETADTLEGNALLKAKTIYDRYKINCFADDTGLEVEALGGKPGVLSARYAGPGHDFDKNIEKLLEALKAKNNTKARFRTIVCLLWNGQTHFFEGIIDGHIIPSRKGLQGFGYDPVFIPEGYHVTFAEMSAEEKNSISHRAIAVNKMVTFLGLQVV